MNKFFFLLSVILFAIHLFLCDSLVLSAGSVSFNVICLCHLVAPSFSFSLFLFHSWLLLVAGPTCASFVSNRIRIWIIFCLLQRYTLTFFNNLGMQSGWLFGWQSTLPLIRYLLPWQRYKSPIISNMLNYNFTLWSDLVRRIESQPIAMKRKFKWNGFTQIWWIEVQ